ncbi:amino acid-binding domain sensor histidine kinase [Seinonella peptonophila]|uniref:histidine kinase n=1 Tax=Seinonella peptonophila TaxID=112248 RepID=A0A1M4U2S6_9BACL|nr:transporter substrate-binding domain-containing protein [Seinonella peptonophila]SHE50993.1 amino acid-binding domain sensor histidine kinase [Seinonella peptonophila]
MRRLVFVIILFSLFSLFGFSSISSIVGNEPIRTIRIAGDRHFPPFEFLSENGVYTGFNVDVMNAISIQTGIRFEFVPMPWEQAIKALHRGQVDAIQGMKYSVARDRVYDFSKPYFTSRQAIFVRKDNLYVRELKDIKKMRVAVQKGDIANELIQSDHGNQLVEVMNQQEAIQLLADGKVDAFVGNRITGQYFVQTMKKQSMIKIVGEPLHPQDYGLAVLPKNKQLLTVINEGISMIKKDGTYIKIEKKWFGEYIMPLSAEIERWMFWLKVGVGVAALLLLGIFWWNRQLKKEVAKRTHEIERMNQLLQEKLDLLEEHHRFQQRLEIQMTESNRLRSLGQLMLGIAHEIRNPLTSILTYTQLLPQKMNNPTFCKNFSEQVTSEITRLNDLVNDLLNYARPRKSTPALFQLHDLVEHIMLLLNAKCHEKNLTVQIDISRSCELYADRHQVQQILLNLIMNAIQALDLGGQLMISARSIEKHVRIEVIDNGHGIEEEEIYRIFEPFYSNKNGGIGLGLAISYQLIKENHGSVHVKSQLEKGTNFTLTFPNQLPKEDVNILCTTS